MEDHPHTRHIVKRQGAVQWYVCVGVSVDVRRGMLFQYVTIVVLRLAST